MLRIDNWSCTTRGDQRWLAPEQICICLQGTVKNHPTVEDGHVVTSHIVSVIGRRVTTKSGSV